MNDIRKKILYGVFALMLCAAGGKYLLESFNGPVMRERAKSKGLKKKIKAQKKKLKETAKTREQLAVWETQSLPSDPSLAGSLYQAWLIRLIKLSGLNDPNVDSESASDRRGLYKSISFTVRARGSLEQLTAFLYRFYQADHLHQIKSLDLTPLEKQGGVVISMKIEALVLPGAERRDRLNTGISDRLAFEKLADYRAIVERDLFGVGGGLDAAEQTYLTGIAYTNNRPQAWFTLRAEDRILKLHIGERIRVGQFTGTVVEIDKSDVILESDGQHWLISIGENLDQAFALPPEFQGQNGSARDAAPNQTNREEQEQKSDI